MKTVEGRGIARNRDEERETEGTEQHNDGDSEDEKLKSCK